VDGELKKDREEDVEVEDVGERSFPGKLLDGLEKRKKSRRVSDRRRERAKETRRGETHLGSRDAEETDAHEHSGDGDLKAENGKKLIVRKSSIRN